MQVQVNFGDIESSSALNEHVNHALDKELEHVSERVTRVEVHLRDDKQKRRGPDDKRCLMEVRLRGQQPIAVEARGADIYRAVTDAAAKLGRAVARKVDRHRSL